MLKNLSTVFVATLILALTTTTALRADIVATSGAVTEVPAPQSLVLNAFTSQTQIFAIEEQTLTLTNSLTVELSAPGVYTAIPTDTPGIITVGETVTSYIFHQDTFPNDVVLNGSVTFSRDILGVIYSDSELDATDVLFGVTGTTYPTGEFLRASLDSTEGPTDQLTISSDLRTITFDINRTGGHSDQLRVILAPVPEPSAAVIVGTLMFAASSRRRR